MHLAVDARPLAWEGGGISRICTNLLPAIQAEGKHDVTVYGNRPPSRPPVGFDVNVLPASLSLYALRDLPRAVLRSGADVLLSLAPEVARPVVPSVLVLYDLYAMFYSQWLKPRDRMSRSYWRQVAAARLRLASIERLAGVVAISRHSAEDLARLRPSLKVPVSVALPASDPVFMSWSQPEATSHVASSYGLRGPFVLYAGAINAQKNVNTLVTSVRLLKNDGVFGQRRLVLVGRDSWPATRLDLAGLEDTVLRLSGLDDRDLAALYAACDAFVLPSLYEGFGLPALEAMAAGAPVLVADTSALPEVVGDAGVLFDPRDPADLASKLAEVLADPDCRARLRASGRRRASSFSWGGMARTVLEAVEAADRAG